MTFEEWFLAYYRKHGFITSKDEALKIWCETNNYSIKYQPIDEMLAVWNHQQAKIDDLLVHKDNLVLSNIHLATINAEQAEELKALRGFANLLLFEGDDCDQDMIDYFAVDIGLIDEDGNPTKLLTGEK